VSEQSPEEGRRERMAETVRLVITHRERAPRSPRLERALKRLIWRYSQEIRSATTPKEEDDEE
jgi:hypothetical protein